MGLPAIISMIENDNELEDVIKKYDKDFDLSFSLDKKFEKKPSPYILMADLASIESFSEFYKNNQKLKTNLRGLLIREEEQDGLEISHLLETLRISTKLVLGIHDPETLDRIIYAWKIGAQNELIATASVLGKFIAVKGCNFERLIVPFAKIEALKDAKDEDLKKFEIAKRGNYIHWPTLDVHLDLESFKVALDPKLKVKIQNEMTKDNAKFGEAIRDLRKAHGLTQGDFELSDKQIRRFESGEHRPTLKAYEALAKAHKMGVSEYMNKLAELYQR